MSSVVLRIALHGLIALAPTTDDNGVNHMTALLVDATDTTTPHECMSAHIPRIKFTAARSAECLRADCRVVGYQCFCEAKALRGKHVSVTFTPDPSLIAPRLNNALPKALPGTSDEAGDFSYVANLAQLPFGLTLDPRYLSDNPPADNPPAKSKLLARMEVPYKTVTACSLAMREDGGQANVHALSFRELNVPSLQDEQSQALAQKVIAELEVPDGEVSLHISDFNKANDHKIVLLARSAGYRIDVANEPERPIDRDDPCNDGVARHFAMFYEFAEKPSDPSKRLTPLLPHVRPTQSKPYDNRIKPEICSDPFFTTFDRPICPMASFNP